MKSQIQLLKKSKQIHSTWYREQYPDVAILGMDPAEHYLKYGAHLGRNPGKGFDTNFYLETYPDVKETGMNPLLHYVLYGKKEGRARKLNYVDPVRRAKAEVEPVRRKLLSLGFTDQPLIELHGLLSGSPNPVVRALAAQELALWHMRGKTEADYRMALQHIAAAREIAPDIGFGSTLSVGELLCHYFLGQFDEGRAAYDRAARAGEASPDVMLAWANFQTTPAGRVAWINRALKRYGVPPVRLLEGKDPPYDRLTSAETLSAVTDGPLVTVLIAAYEAAETLPTALRSLQEQTWKNLEIIVIDDCSPSPGTCKVAEAFRVRDPRIRLIRMEKNGGAYVARNRGLDAATGDYVTIHDADDWSHPLKIETQVRFMEANQEVMGCTSEQARASNDLFFTKWGSHGIARFVKENVSSFMHRHKPVFERVGYWDSVRFGADSEKMKRIRLAFGEGSVHSLATGPLSFQRVSESSIVSDDAFGMDGFFFGARLEYFEGQLESHTKFLHYVEPCHPQFAVPAVMRPNRATLSRHFDVIIGSDFRMHGGSTRSTIEEVVCQTSAGLRTGLIQMYRYDYPVKAKRMISEMRDVLDGETSLPICYGETVSCDLLILRYPPILQHRQRYVPKIEAKNVKVIVNQPPMSDYTPDGVVRYKLADCAENIRHYFGKDATWHPIGPLVREALHNYHADDLYHIDLSPDDWHNIIDVKGWDRGPRSHGQFDRLRIGRHSRDHFTKWPATAEDVLAAYPATGDIEVHVLGGAESPAALIGGIPENWRVHNFGALRPKDFLSDIDVFVYFAHPDWVESFGRSIIEAMATGVPVILPEVYRPLFQDAALYTTPAGVVEVAQKLCARPLEYDAQVAQAKRYVAERFSYDVHLKRLQAASVSDA